MNNKDLNKFFSLSRFIENGGTHSLAFELAKSKNIENLPAAVCGKEVPGDNITFAFEEHSYNRVNNPFRKVDWEYIFLIDLDKDVLEVYSRLLYIKNNKDIQSSLFLTVDRELDARYLLNGSVLLVEDKALLD
jgi:hypothetical protein